MSTRTDTPSAQNAKDALTVQFFLVALMAQVLSAQSPTLVGETAGLVIAFVAFLAAIVVRFKQ